MIRAVLDTNILVSAAIEPEGKPAQIFRQFPAQFELLTSDYILEELAEALGRRHIRRRYPQQVTPERRTGFLTKLQEIATVVEVTTRSLVLQEDEEDNAILACAKDGGADYLVTGDPDLLNLGTFEGIKVVSPNEFLRILRS